MASSLSILVLCAPQAHAFELFGIQFFGGDAQEDDIVIADPRSYALDFSAEAPEEIETVLQSASTLWQDREEPASGVPGLLSKARGDYRRLTAALYNEGYYGGSVSILVEGREASTLPPDVSLPDPARIAVRVSTGPRFTFSTTRIENSAPIAAADADQVETLAEAGFAQGQPARAGTIARAEQLSIEAWRRQSYPKAEIAAREVVADHPTNTLEVVAVVDPGRYASFGPVSVRGAERMDPDFIIRQTGLIPGTPYHPEDVDQARTRLSRLDVFSTLRLEAAAEITPEGTLPYEVVVQERPLRRFGVGATVSSVDGLGVEGFWLHRNLFGQAERLRLDARIAGIGYPVETAEFDYFFGGTFTKPGIFTPDTDLVASASAQYEVLPLYTEAALQGRIGLQHLFFGAINGEGGAAFRQSYVEDQTFGARTFTTAGLYGEATYDTRDSELDPTEGIYLSGTLDPVYEFSYGNPIVRATVEGRTYFGFGEDNDYVLAARVRAGALAGPDLSEIPPSMLFFAGGGGSVRGYGFRSIGVEDQDGNLTGGRYLLEASLEARARITEDIGVVGFVDGGYVAADTFPGLEDLRLGAGVGLRYHTGLGPLRLDAAIPLNKREGDPDYALYVGIGQSF
nr:autotransporter assembly complex family protein [Pelagibacterium montanilacus]